MSITLFTAETADKVLDISDAIEEGFTWSTDMDYTAGELSFTIHSLDYLPQHGDKIRFEWMGQKVFVGYVFEWEVSSDESLSIVAYDALRYLKSQDTLVLPVQSLKERFEQICQTAGLAYKTASLADIRLPAGFFDGKTYFDILKAACDDVYRASGVLYFLRDNYGTIELISTRNTQTDLAVGDNSLGNGWRFKSSIAEAYNAVKVVKSDSDKGIQAVAVAEGESIERWGRLQKVERADDKANDAQMAQAAQDYLKTYDKPQQTTNLTNALGILEVRAGTVFNIDFETMRKAGIKTSRAYASKVTHTFANVWTMDVEVVYE